MIFASDETETADKPSNFPAEFDETAETETAKSSDALPVVNNEEVLARIDAHPEHITDTSRLSTPIIPCECTTCRKHSPQHHSFPRLLLTH